MIKAIVTDIEGTTSDIRFVHDVLFPYARARLADTVAQADEQPEVAEALAALRIELGQPEAGEIQLVEALAQFMAQDRKSTALKTLQGIIWRTGYRRGDFHGHVYDDVTPQLHAWLEQGIKLYVYSSGSVEAQQLLFGHSEVGDLRPLFSGYFDTRVGAKREVASYRNIADAVALPAAEILFLSDIHQELDAARSAGWQTCQLLRGAADPHSDHPQVSRFDQIDVQEISQ
ncbi:MULTISPECIES: acireductone synthase [Lonsdalea]|uniref:2,3-diketo-5-methylthio-1-phosphopentane phosphatase n=2 Tax=Lonsdalea TaxID=1082702 RepID=A0ACD1JD03_9GAMM|nr:MULTISPECIES: acireductone synthase [Lonsdalea]OSM94702.1 2,3-diketo-5-methylthio-1-phosphopentane phosphatase [Lonsdalea populi]OSM99743.1 2,3-diketo-5-methylthio-1-phosphopentane phosphatase [Lonsdalea populi]QPQ24857.1 acireductone synthase [Lonsdalea populi]RAT13737.1 2,3-diketo-5-methylthio-1-phosphopentane phosphatase [Lonsdalea quercina]RAT15827.1 2,3-diketo-5-methylthio-1-phosphopentane phosphatase [Lonsdalea quercina]